jgi:2,3-dihydroxybenzoate decarboxylase
MRALKIAVEEHMADPGTVDNTKGLFDGRPWMRDYLLNVQGQLLADMDAAGIEMSILSLSALGIQGIPARKQAVEAAQRANDYLAEQVARNPKRFQGFAALPMQDPDAAARELARCVKELGFRGALVNGFSQVDTEHSAVYLDMPQYWDFWGTVESLDVPFYLHPRDPLPGWTPFLDGHPWFMAARLAFTIETSSHALRLMASGLFDKYPKLTIVLGHLGETIPNQIWRIDHRIAVMPPKGIPAKKKLDEYFRNNFYVTTSGNYCTPTFMNTVQWMGTDRVLFAVDFPFEKVNEAVQWFDNLDVINETDWNKIARTNAEKLFKLNTPSEPIKTDCNVNPKNEKEFS